MNLNKLLKIVIGLILAYYLLQAIIIILWIVH